MQQYLRTAQAEEDLIGIWNYSADTWGEKQADRYLHLLDTCCLKIAKGEIKGKRPLTAYPKLFSVRCEHHYLFYLAAATPVIVAVLHEKMDCITRLHKRLDNGYGQ